MSKQFQYIASLCENINANGKTPSVALIKKASNQPLPLKDIIDVLKSWQSDPEQFSTDTVNTPNTDKPNDLRTYIGSLEERIVKLEKQVEALKNKR